MWALGKVHQRLGEHEKALSWFLKAYELETENADVAREASLAAMALGDVDQALALSRAAMQRRPEDAGLVANHALALLLGGQVDAALVLAKQSVEANPRDEISRNVLRWVRAVKDGNKAKPAKISMA